MSGETAIRLERTKQDPQLPAIIAKEYIIDGEKFADIKEYITKKEREEQIRREAEERARREQARRDKEEEDRKAAEAKRKAERDRINEEIFDLTYEMDSLKGLFAGMKRKKLQKRIDELNEQLRKL